MNASLNHWTATNDNKCPICLNAGAEFIPNGAAIAIQCRRCDRYMISTEALGELQNRSQIDQVIRSIASSWVREQFDLTIHSGDIDALFRRTRPSVAERAERLFVALSKRHPGTGDGVLVQFDGSDNLILEAQSWSVDTQELRYLLEKFLIGEKSWLTCGQNSGGRLNCQVTPKGYEYLDELQRSRTDSNRGFCAMWFAESFIDVWNKAIGPAIEAAGYEPIRVDKVEHVNRIDDEIISQIRRSKFLVCDFTEQRAGVYFEAGFGLGLGKQVIWTVHKDHLNKVHFDNRQYNFIVWDENDYVKFREALSARIVALLGPGLTFSEKPPN